MRSGGGSPAPGRSRGRRILTGLLAALAGALLFAALAVGAVLAFPDAIISPVAQARIEAAVAAESHALLEIGALHTAPLSGVVLERVLLRDPLAPEGAPPVASIARIALPVDTLSLAGETALVGEVVLEGVLLRLEREANGGWNLARLLAPRPKEGASEEAARPPSKGGPALPFGVSLEGLRLEGLTVLVSDPALGAPFSVACAPLRVPRVSIDRALTLARSVTLALSVTASLGDPRADAAAPAQGTDAARTVTLSLEALLGPGSLTTGGSGFDAALESLRLETAAGAVTAKGTATGLLGREAPSLEGEVDGRIDLARLRSQLEGVARISPSHEATGPLTIHAKATPVPDAGARAWRFEASLDLGAVAARIAPAPGAPAAFEKKAGVPCGLRLVGAGGPDGVRIDPPSGFTLGTALVLVSGTADASLERIAARISTRKEGLPLTQLGSVIPALRGADGRVAFEVRAARVPPASQDTGAKVGTSSPLLLEVRASAHGVSIEDRAAASSERRTPLRVGDLALDARAEGGALRIGPIRAEAIEVLLVRETDGTTNLGRLFGLDAPTAKGPAPGSVRAPQGSFEPAAVTAATPPADPVMGVSPAALPFTSLDFAGASVKSAVVDIDDRGLCRRIRVDPCVLDVKPFTLDGALRPDRPVEVTLQVGASEGGRSVGGLRLTAKATAAPGAGLLDMDRISATADGAIEALDLCAVHALLGAALPLDRAAGRIDGAVRGSARPGGEARLEAELTSRDLSVAGGAMGPRTLATRGPVALSLTLAGRPDDVAASVNLDASAAQVRARETDPGAPGGVREHLLKPPGTPLTLRLDARGDPAAAARLLPTSMLTLGAAVLGLDASLEAGPADGGPARRERTRLVAHLRTPGAPIDLADLAAVVPAMTGLSGDLALAVTATQDLATTEDAAAAAVGISATSPYRGLARLRAEGSARSARLARGGDTIVEGLDAAFALSGNQARLTTNTFRLNGGASTLEADADLRGDTPAHRSRLKADDVGVSGFLAGPLGYVSPLLAVFAAQEGAPVNLTASLDGEFKGAGFGAAELLHSLWAQGTVAIGAGNLSGSPAIAALGDVLGSSGLKELSFERFAQGFSIDDGRVRLPPIPIRGKPVTFTIGGTTSLDGGLDHRITVRAGDIRKGALRGLSNVDIPIPIRIGGTIGAPTLVPPSEADLAELLKGSVVEEGAKLLEGLLDRKKRKKDSRGDPPAGSAPAPGAETEPTPAPTPEPPNAEPPTVEPAPASPPPATGPQPGYAEPVEDE